MKIIKPSATIEAYTPGLEQVIEAAGRTCWKSEDKITDCIEDTEAFIKRIKNYKHESVLEHGSITVRFIIDRGVSHELVRHRMASFSQESTRYCNYSKNKFGQEITVIDPSEAFGWEFNSPIRDIWETGCQQSEINYFTMLEAGATPQEARDVLVTSLKTEVVMTANPREWLHVFRLRCSRDAHPQIREVMIPLREDFQNRWPSVFLIGEEE